MDGLKLSICIATYKRGLFIGETLDSILGQIEPGVELVVVDGASPDNTPEVMAQYLLRYPEIRYYRETENSGVDADYDKAVGYARGAYCWLMTDDDLLCRGAIARVLASLDGDEDLIVVNSEVRNKDLSLVLESKRLMFDTDRVYRSEVSEVLFADTAGCLSFIASVVIRRTCWLSRNRSDYYGTLFVHVGVIFQNPPITNARVIAQPLIVVRHGNEMWTPRSFEIWMFKWPKLIWSFQDFSDSVKRKVVPREPWRNAKTLFHNRARGAYSADEFFKFWPIRAGNVERVIAYALSIFPASLANISMMVYFVLLAKPAKMQLHDLACSRHAGVLSRLLSHALGLGKR